MGILDHLICLLRNLFGVSQEKPVEKPVAVSQKQQLEPSMTKLIGTKLGKEKYKPVYCYPAYLTHMMLITSGETPGWNQDCWGKCQQPQMCR